MTLNTDAILEEIESMGYTGDDLTIRQAFCVNRAADEDYRDALVHCDAESARQAEILRQATRRILARYGYEGKG
jgi:hypothetical protein